MARRDRKTKSARAALSKAKTYTEWREAAALVDALEGADAWREEPESPHYDHGLIREHRDRMHTMRVAKDARGLRNLLEETLHRSIGDLSNVSLYQRSLLGTKHLIEGYIREVTLAIEWLCSAPIEGFTLERKLEMLERGIMLFGRSALILSGGGALGLFHLGVVKSLFDEGILPEIISGASMGAIVAAGVCTRTDAELAELWGDVGSIHRTATRMQWPTAWAKSRSILAPEQLREHVEANIAEMTFAQAREHSGRSLNIPVSPVRRRQKPRLLNHITSSEVLITDAAVASCSLPALFPPGKLRRRNQDGTIEPYIRDEVWVDGSIYSDVPAQRLGRLLNVNHFIVSQANPHIFPLRAIEQGQGPASTVADLVAGGARAQGRHALDLARRRLGDSQWRAPLEFAHAMANQNYTGDINIYPDFRVTDLGRVMKNPSLTELEAYIESGERATWPRLAMIRDQTAISRCMVRCAAALREEIAAR